MTQQLLDHLTDWTEQLTGVAAKPLELCPEFPAIAQRFEAWWSQSATDRPIFIGSANTNSARPVTRRLNLLSHPEAWFEAKKADLRQTHHVGDAVPSIRTDFGPVMLGGILGGVTEFGADTSWTHAFIDDEWSNEPDWTLPADHPLWVLLGELIDLVAADAAGKYHVCMPDLGAPSDVLLNLRSSAPLCLDVVDQPRRITGALEKIYESYRRAFSELYRRTLKPGAGLIHWIQLWSNQPYAVPACDFSYLIGKPEFDRLFLPDVERQASTTERAAFHLDGPEATRHIDSLLELSQIQAIQFTPGTGTPSTLAWVEMFKKIQAKGRSLLICCPPAEVPALADQLKPEGLALWVNGGLSATELDGLFDRFCRKFGLRI